MADDYNSDADCLASYDHAIRAIGDEVRATGVIPDCLLGTGEHTKRLLEEREKTHGRFEDNARIAQELRRLFRQQYGWGQISTVQREALDMIATKLGRVLSSKGTEPDHFRDIAGYAELAARDCD